MRLWRLFCLFAAIIAFGAVLSPLPAGSTWPHWGDAVLAFLGGINFGVAARG